MIYRIYADYMGKVHQGELDDSRIHREAVRSRQWGGPGYGDCIRIPGSESLGYMTANGAVKVITDSESSSKGWTNFWKFEEAGPNWKAGDFIQKLLDHIRVQSPASDENDLMDPDPFIIGMNLINMLTGGATFLETRRRNRENSEEYRRRYGSSFHRAFRKLTEASSHVSQFESYLDELSFRHLTYEYGVERLLLTRGQKRELRGYLRRVQTTGTDLLSALDQLSDYLRPEHQYLINEIHEIVRDIQGPHSFDAVAILARRAISVYIHLLDTVNEEEGFLRSADRSSSVEEYLERMGVRERI